MKRTAVVASLVLGVAAGAFAQEARVAPEASVGDETTAADDARVVDDVPVGDDTPVMSDVPAGEEAPGGESALTTTLTGYLDTRFTYVHTLAKRLLPSDDVPSLQALVETNAQLKLRWGASGLVIGDASFFYQRAGLFYGVGEDGERTELDAHDVPAYRPAAVISELYGSYNVSETVNVTLGKKRIVWGPGFAQNPTDILNPPKDPTDPSLQRAGAWLLRFEMPFETFTLSFVAAARVLRQYGGVPAAVGVYPDYPTYESARDAQNHPTDGALTFGDPRDDDGHYALVARAYALVADTDINVVYFFTNEYNDAFAHKSRVGLSASRYVTDALELHVEGVGQRGSARIFPEHDCLTDVGAALGCVVSERAPLGRSRLDDDSLVVKGLLGARYTFEDDAMLSLEYYYSSDGYSRRELGDFVRAIGLGRQAIASGVADAGQLADALGTALGGSSDPGSPQKTTFEPLRRHYAFVNYSKPRIRDDFTASLAIIENLAELSTQISPSVTWSVREWLGLSLYGLVAFAGPEALGAKVDGKRYGEHDLVPFDWRVVASARAFY